MTILIVIGHTDFIQVKIPRDLLFFSAAILAATGAVL